MRAAHGVPQPPHRDPDSVHAISEYPTTDIRIDAGTAQIRPARAEPQALPQHPDSAHGHSPTKAGKEDYGRGFGEDESTPTKQEAAPT